MEEKELQGARSFRIVLVETSHPGNIGGAARAMKTMGFADLALVRPRRYPDPQAEWRAAGAGDVLEGARVFDALDDAIADCGLVVGASARQRNIPLPVDTLAEFAATAPARSGGKPVALLFGREASGLSNRELERCRRQLVIPANPGYASLNLAMAVQVTCYELRKALAGTERDADAAQRWDRPLAGAGEVEAFYAHLERALRRIGFDDPKAPRRTMTRLKRLFGRIAMDETEVAMLRGILTHVERAAPDAPGKPGVPDGTRRKA